MSRLEVIILTWNDVDETRACIDSLRLSTRPVDRVILIDNGSPDGSGPRLEALYRDDPFVHFIQNDHNAGFAGGVNLGIRCARDAGAALIFLLNNDTIVDPECLRLLEAELAGDERVGAVMPTICYHAHPDRIWQAGGMLSVAKAGVRVPLKNRPLSERPLHSEEVTFQTGCALLVRREAFDTAGLFDERFFFYSEDLDFSLRLRAHGWTLRYVPTALVLHKIDSIAVDRSTPFVLYHRARSSMLVFRIHFSGVITLWALLIHLGLLTPFRLLQILRGGQSLSSLTAWLRGLVDAFRVPL